MKITTQHTIITLIQTFIMGSIDAFTFQNFNGSFVSAQTGNLVVFAYELASKGWTTAYVRVPVLLGFLLGAFFLKNIVIPSRKIDPLVLLCFPSA